jgi:hypothetical protein
MQCGGSNQNQKSGQQNNEASWLHCESPSVFFDLASQDLLEDCTDCSNDPARKN